LKENSKPNLTGKGKDINSTVPRKGESRAVAKGKEGLPFSSLGVFYALKVYELAAKEREHGGHPGGEGQSYSGELLLPAPRQDVPGEQKEKP